MKLIHFQEKLQSFKDARAYETYILLPAGSFYAAQQEKLAQYALSIRSTWQTNCMFTTR